MQRERYSFHNTISFFVLDEVPIDLVETNPRNASAIHTAVKNGNLTELKSLLRKIEPQINPIVLKSGTAVWTVLSDSAYWGQLEIYKYVSSKLTNINPSVWGSTPLHLAATHGRLDVVKYITSCLLDINPTNAKVSNFIN